jgi:histidine triad (HIT) family protein
MPNKQESSIFVKILQERLEPIIFQDENWFVILSNRPINEGHLLILPKQKSARFYEITDIDRGFNIATQFAKLLQDIYKPPLVSLFVKGFSIEEHAHIHLIPLFKREEMDVRVEDMVTIDSKEMERVAAKIKQALNEQPIS